MNDLKSRALLFTFLIILALLVFAGCSGDSGVSDTKGDGNITDGTAGPSDSSSVKQDDTDDADSSPSVTTGIQDGGNSPEDNNYRNEGWDDKTLKILAIGNSFSDDAMTYLYDIAKAYGVDDVVLGNLYIGGCTLDRHHANAVRDAKEYTYYKNTDGVFKATQGASLLDGLRDEEWDIITMQQASGYSGVERSYSRLPSLIEYVNENKTNENAQLAWHMTWAYQSNSTHADFPKYDNDQMTMYNAICSTVNSQILTKDVYRLIIPSGTAIQNARTSYFGDTLTRDGYHMSDLGRLIVGYCWFSTLTGTDVEDIKYVPSSLFLSEEDKKIIVESVAGAAANPFAVSDSAYTEKEEFDLSGYREIKFEYIVGAYWNTTDPSSHSMPIRTAGNSKYFIATQLFTKNSLPAGSVIVLDSGWQYRPERWASFGSVQSSRPDPVSSALFMVTDEWWQGYSYRAFNISVLGNNKDITSDEDSAEALSHFRIYVPKDAEIEDDPGAIIFPDDGSEEAPDLSRYRRLSFDYTAGAYWNTTDSVNHSQLTKTADNSKYFVATQLFTKETLPAGSVITVDSGWQYRPERWDTFGKKQSARPSAVTTQSFTVTDEWWEGYECRAFNISVIGNSTDISSAEAAKEALSHFSIYVPEE